MYEGARMESHRTERHVAAPDHVVARGISDRTAHSASGTMKAVIHHRYGGPDVLEYVDVDVPAVGDGDVLVRVRAAALSPGDHFLLTGTPYVVRLAFGLRRPRHGIPGRDVAGTVAAVGRDVRGFAPGDEVFGWSTTGTLAEYVCAPAGHFTDKPFSFTTEQAAALPTSGLTALQALRHVADVQPGHRVLITGASGGVGSFAVQIAKALGAEVTGVCSTSNVDLVMASLADAGELTPVIDRTFPLRQAPAAIEHVATRHARGKVVITV